MIEDCKRRIEDVVARLVRALRRVARLEDFRDVAPRPHPPATAEEIRAYEEYLGLKLPRSYRAFLELYNGYDGLAFPGHMLSIRDVMPGGQYYGAVQEWKRTCARYGAGQVLDGIVIAYLDQPNNWAYLDPNRPTGEDECAVVSWSPGGGAEYPDVVHYLEGVLAQCELLLREEPAARGRRRARGPGREGGG